MARVDSRRSRIDLEKNLPNREEQVLRALYAFLLRSGYPVQRIMVTRNPLKGGYDVGVQLISLAGSGKRVLNSHLREITPWDGCGGDAQRAVDEFLSNFKPIKPEGLP